MEKTCDNCKYAREDDITCNHPEACSTYGTEYWEPTEHVQSSVAARTPTTLDKALKKVREIVDEADNRGSMCSQYCTCNNQQPFTTGAGGEAFRVCKKSLGGCGKEII